MSHGTFRFATDNARKSTHVACGSTTRPSRVNHSPKFCAETRLQPDEIGASLSGCSEHGTGPVRRNRVRTMENHVHGDLFPECEIAATVLKRTQTRIQGATPSGHRGGIHLVSNGL